MTLAKCLALAVLAALAPISVDTQEVEYWTYQDQDKWSPQCVTGRRQSPIPINTYDTIYDQSLKTFRFINFNFNVNGSILNSNNRGIRWTVDLPEEDPKLPKVVGGGLQGDYYIRYLDFKWAGNDCDGSEHYIDYKPSILEVQLVTYRSAKDNNEADLTTDTIAIFSYLFEYGDANINFAPLFNAVDRIVSIGVPIPVNISLSNVLPSITDTPQYYRYNGSLPTPPCLETVVWTVFADKQTISRQQMNSFRKIMEMGPSSSRPVQVAYRKLQRPYDRRIITNVRSQTSGQGGNKAGKGNQAGQSGVGAADSLKVSPTLAVFAAIALAALDLVLF